MNNVQLRGGRPRERTTFSPPRRYDVPRSLPQLWSLLLTGAARPARFALIGALCAGLQLAFLALLLQVAIAPLGANVAAYLLSAQANFVLSDRFIWHDRRDGRRDGLMRRWLSFHGSIAGTFALSQVVFLVGRVALPNLAASATGIAIAAIANFAIQDRLTFR